MGHGDLPAARGAADRERRARSAHDGKIVAELVRGTSLVVPKARSKGAWVVYAVATLGNVSRPSAALPVR